MSFLLCVMLLPTLLWAQQEPAEAQQQAAQEQVTPVPTLPELPDASTAAPSTSMSFGDANLSDLLAPIITTADLTGPTANPNVMSSLQELGIPSSLFPTQSVTTTTTDVVSVPDCDCVTNAIAPCCAPDSSQYDGTLRSIIHDQTLVAAQEHYAQQIAHKIRSMQEDLKARIAALQKEQDNYNLQVAKTSQWKSLLLHRVDAYLKETQRSLAGGSSGLVSHSSAATQQQQQKQESASASSAESGASTEEFFFRSKRQDESRDFDQHLSALQRLRRMAARHQKHE